MDRYTKAVLTVFAASLFLITLKLWEPREAQAAMFGSGPTFGDLRNAKDDAARERMFNSMPAVRVFGSVSVN